MKNKDECDVEINQRLVKEGIKKVFRWIEYPTLVLRWEFSNFIKLTKIVYLWFCSAINESHLSVLYESVKRNQNQTKNRCVPMKICGKDLNKFLWWRATQRNSKTKQTYILENCPHFLWN